MTLRYIIFALYVLSTVPTTALADDPFQTAPAPQASPPTSAYHPRPAQPEAEPPAAASPAPPVAATPVPASPRGFANRSYGEEETDFGVAPQNVLQSRVGAPTPTTVPGAQTIYTYALYSALAQNPGGVALIDVWDDAGHLTLPGAHRLPGAGGPGVAGDVVTQGLAGRLAALTGGNNSAALVFFCAGVRCWESYNAILRAETLGYHRLYWYRGGVQAWRLAGLGLVR